MSQARSIQDEMYGEAPGAQGWLDAYDDNFLACRVGHNWPQIVPHRKLTRTTISPSEDARDRRNGVFVITQTCSRCSRVRWRLTGRNGLLDDGMSMWHYRDPEGYAQPKGMGLARGRFTSEFWRRIMEDYAVQQTARAESGA